MVQGHNESIAWGSTTNPADVTDWYLEDVSSDAFGNLSSHYLGNPEPITELPLQVKVNCDNGNLRRLRARRARGRGGRSHLRDQRRGRHHGLLANFVPAKVLVVGRHGPIFPQTLEPFPFPNNHSGGSALAIQFTGLYPTRELETFFVWNQATDLNQFKTGLQLFDFGSQNWAYGDIAGNIAYFASGEFPIREDIDAGAVSGNPPFVIRDGTGGNEWKALGGPQPADQSVPYEIVATADVPQVENPPAGWFVNANNDPIGNTADNDPLDEALAGTGPYLSVGYDEFRAARITELIKSELNLIATPPGTPAGDGTISFADMQRMQADVNQLDGSSPCRLLRDRGRQRRSRRRTARARGAFQLPDRRRARPARGLDLQHARRFRHRRRSRCADGAGARSIAPPPRSTTSPSGSSWSAPSTRPWRRTASAIARAATKACAGCFVFSTPSPSPASAPRASTSSTTRA